MYFSGSFLAWSAKNLRTRLVKTSRSFLFKRKKKEKKIVKYPKPIGMGVGQRQAWQESGKSSNVSPKFFCLKHIVRKFSTINTQAEIIHPISYPFIGLSLWKYIYTNITHQSTSWTVEETNDFKCLLLLHTDIVYHLPELNVINSPASTCSGTDEM